MRKTVLLFILTAALLTGCAVQTPQAQIAATTLPVYEFTARLCGGTGLTVTQLVTEQVSCLHDYALNVRQVRAAEAAELVVISGAGLEDFMEDLLHEKSVIDCSAGIVLIEGGHHHEHGDESPEEHHHEEDPHIWLSPENAMVMAENICAGLSEQYPECADIFQQNLEGLLAELATLQAYGEAQLANLSCRELITFHDGFAYLAESFDLEILEAVEEESGSEASAAELIHLIGEVRRHALPAVFTEALGSVSAAQTIAAETGVDIYTLDMAMHGEGYFSAMYHNINTLKGALG
ncbi:MAG: zinc ABC transporter substrate-binding protein [Oscillospiraceae bacterium]|nr:zinc ABC transporter substrate-binding protein [Oscillospiraceae bacterium]